MAHLIFNPFRRIIFENVFSRPNYLKNRCSISKHMYNFAVSKSNRLPSRLTRQPVVRMIFDNCGLNCPQKVSSPGTASSLFRPRLLSQPWANHFQLLLQHSLCQTHADHDLKRRAMTRNAKLANTKKSKGDMAVTMTKRPISAWSPFAARHKWARLAATTPNTAMTTKTAVIENRARVFSEC